jgi:hypothetical protein
LAPIACNVSLGSTSSSTAPSDDCQNPPVVKDPAKALPGKPCMVDADCKYGVCSKSAAMLAGNGDVAICVASCACGGAGCSADDDPSQGVAFTCSRVGAYNQCGFKCKTDDDCLKWNAQTCHCVGEVKGYVQGGTYKVCVRGSDCPVL